MIKRFQWIFLAMLTGGVILWLVLSGGGRREESAKSQPGENNRRQSSRRRTGEVEKNIPTPLENKVAEQERLVEEQKVELFALLKARNSNSGQPGEESPPNTTPEEEAKKADAAQAFEDARQAYNANRQVLEKLKLELAEEQK